MSKIIVPIDPSQVPAPNPPSFDPDSIFQNIVLAMLRACLWQNMPLVKQYHIDVDAGKTEPPPMLQGLDVDVLWDWHRGLRPDSNWAAIPAAAFVTAPAPVYTAPPPPPAFTLGPPIPSIVYGGVQYYAVPGDNPAVPFSVPFALAGSNYIKTEIPGLQSPFSPAPDHGVIGWVKLS